MHQFRAMSTKNLLLLVLLSGTLIQASCSNVAAKVFGSKTPRERYEQKLEDKGLHKTPEGRRWLVASASALQQPVTINLPFQLKGHFPDSQQLALGLSFEARKGQRIQFQLDKQATSGLPLYADLYAMDASGSQRFLYGADTSANIFSFDIDADGAYLLRLQPELLKGGSYALSITKGPSIGFPVTDPKANIGSLWGAPRDGGTRNHEGIDIFARKGSPAIAAADGIVTGVKDGGIGGKVVWLRATDKDYTLYYAHLDQQLVQPGQLVKQGDTLGTVGNTGNARTTPAHLHFGVYTFRGPIDPLPFVQKNSAKPAAVPAKSLDGYLRLLKAEKDISTKPNTVVTPLAVASTGYLVALPNGQVMQTPFASVQAAQKPLKQQAAPYQVALLNLPVSDAKPKLLVPKGSSLEVLGYFNNYTLVRSGSVEGWVLNSPSES